MIIVYTLPVSRKNVLQSAYIVNREDAHFRMGIWQLDNYTDAIMINNAYIKSSDYSILDNVINSYIVKYPNEEYAESLIQFINGEANYYINSYSRYWHGYLLFLKPLLILFDYSEIRTLNICIQFILFCYLCFQLYKNQLKKYILVYILMYYIISPIATGFSLQYSSIFYITVLSVNFLLNKYDVIDRINLYIELFFLQGILIAYFDFLTYPVFALCILLLTYLLKNIGNDNIKYITQLGNILKYSFAWCFGYVLMWASKWIIASIVNHDLSELHNAISEVNYRSSAQASDLCISAESVIFENIIQYKSWMFLFPVIICIIVIFYKKTFEFSPIRVCNMILYIFISLYPFVWYIVFKNHSYIHAWFACKSLAASLGSGVCGFMQLIKSD